MWTTTTVLLLTKQLLVISRRGTQLHPSIHLLTHIHPRFKVEKELGMPIDLQTFMRNSYRQFSNKNKCLYLWPSSTCAERRRVIKIFVEISLPLQFRCHLIGSRFCLRLSPSWAHLVVETAAAAVSPNKIKNSTQPINQLMCPELGQQRQKHRQGAKKEIAHKIEPRNIYCDIDQFDLMLLIQCRCRDFSCSSLVAGDQQ